MTSFHSRLNLFRTELNLIKDRRVVCLTEYILSKVPEYFFQVPASSTGKNHPLVARNPHGLVYHTKLVVQFALKLIDANPYIVNRDQIIVACIFHDVLKQGYPEVENTSTVDNHPILAASFIRNTTSDYIIHHSRDNFYNGDINFIINFGNEVASLIETHMGKWNKEFLPTPKTTDQILVHTADYLAAQFNNLDLSKEEHNLIFNV